MRRIFFIRVVALAVWLAAAASSQAATFWWNGTVGGTSNWGSTASWSTSASSVVAPAAVPGASDDLVFNIDANNGGGSTVNLATTDRVANSLLFSTTAATTIVRNTSTSTTHENFLTLGGGGITVSSTSGPVTTGTSNNRVGVRLTTSAFSVTNNSSSLVTFGRPMAPASTFTGTSTLSILGSGTGGYSFGGFSETSGTNVLALVVNTNASARTTLNASSSHSGGTAINSGLVVASAGSSLGTGTVTINGGGLSGDSTGRTLANNVVVNNDFQLGGGGGSLTLNGAIDLGNTTRTVTLRNSNFINGTVSNGGLTLNFGNVSLRLNGTNTYSGGTTLTGNSAGTLTAGSTNAFGTGPLAANVGTVNLNGFNVSIGQLSGSSGATITSNVAGAAGLTTNGAGTSTYAGRITDGSGTVGFTKAGGGTLTLSGSNAFSGGTTVSAGTLLAGNANAFGTGTVTVGGGTLDLGSLTVTNALQLQSGGLSNAAAYAGTQTVSGTFAYSPGSIGGTINAVAGGILKGGGEFTGGVTIGDGAIHAPGNSPGSQTFAAGLSYSGSSTLEWELISSTTTGPGTNYDSIAVTGGSLSITNGAALQLLFSGSGSTVNWNDSFWNSNRTWTVIDVGEGLTSTGIFALLGDPSTWLDSNSTSLASAMGPNNRTTSTFTVDNSTGSILLNYSVVTVPEPSTLALLGLGVAALAAARQTRRR